MRAVRANHQQHPYCRQDHSCLRSTPRRQRVADLHSGHVGRCLVFVHLVRHSLRVAQMPTLNLNTNVPGNRVDNSDLLKALSKAMASSIGKPEQWVMVSVTTDKSMCFAGTEEPCAYGEIISIGSIGGAKNAQISAAIADVVTAKLGVPKSRVYLQFSDVARTDFGWNGGTF